LRAEDEALWRRFTQTIEPSRFRPRVPESDASGAAIRSSHGDAQRADGAGAHGGKYRPLEPVLPGALPPGARSQGKSPAKAAPQVIDHKVVRRLGNGRAAIDARVDLHGLRLSEAHGVLRRFLFSAIQKGHRMVLVITGKGGQRRAASVVDPAYEDIIYEGRQDAGVLRRQVPMWLREPEFQAIVVGFTTAHVRHGGEGALYVQLRRRK
jgi:DNA-nicking Smr family endonuclease